MQDNNQTTNQGNVTVGQAKAQWSEVMFKLAMFFGVLHFIGIFCHVVVMYANTSLGKIINIPLKSSQLMGNLYLAVLAAYVGQKEFFRWFGQNAEDAEMPQTVLLKFSRGEAIVSVWAIFTGMVVFIKEWGLINEVPEVLLYTTGEVIAILCGSYASKYIRSRHSVSKQQEKETRDNFADKAVDYCKTKGSIDNSDCQREFGLSKDQAYRLLNGLYKSGKLKAEGEGRYRVYKPA